MEGTIGTILLWPVPGFVPRFWLPCEGQSLPIQQYQALYSLLGLTYGGDAVRSFNLPDLRGAVPVGAGTGVALGNKVEAAQPGLAVQYANDVASAIAKAGGAPGAAATNVQRAKIPAVPTQVALRYIICVEGIYPDRPD